MEKYDDSFLIPSKISYCKQRMNTFLKLWIFAMLEMLGVAFLNDIVVLDTLFKVSLWIGIPTAIISCIAFFGYLYNYEVELEAEWDKQKENKKIDTGEDE